MSEELAMVQDDDLSEWEIIAMKDPRYRGLPDALIKACFDDFTFALGLRTGQIIRFATASVSPDGKWVHLCVHSAFAYDKPMLGIDYSFERGIDVRVDDIVWVADAPEGS